MPPAVEVQSLHHWTTREVPPPNMEMFSSEKCKMSAGQTKTAPVHHGLYVYLFRLLEEKLCFDPSHLFPPTRPQLGFLACGSSARLLIMINLLWQQSWVLYGCPFGSLGGQSKQHDSRVLKALYPLAVVGRVYEESWGELSRLVSPGMGNGLGKR